MFTDTSNLPRDIADIRPNITVARARPIRVVMVLDTSGSMSVSNQNTFKENNFKILFLPLNTGI